jgi:hypothetical protein
MGTQSFAHATLVIYFLLEQWEPLKALSVALVVGWAKSFARAHCCEPTCMGMQSFAHATLVIYFLLPIQRLIIDMPIGYAFRLSSATQ